MRPLLRSREGSTTMTTFVAPFPNRTTKPSLSTSKSRPKPILLSITRIVGDAPTFFMAGGCSQKVAIYLS